MVPSPLSFRPSRPPPVGSVISCSSSPSCCGPCCHTSKLWLYCSYSSLCTFGTSISTQPSPSCCGPCFHIICFFNPPSGVLAGTQQPEQPGQSVVLTTHPKRHCASLFFGPQSPPTTCLASCSVGGGHSSDSIDTSGGSNPLCTSTYQHSNPISNCTQSICTAPSSIPTTPTPNSSTAPITVTNLKFCCLNLHGLSSNLSYLQHILSNHSPDIIAVSELWLHDYNLHNIQQVHPNYKFMAACPPRQEHPVFCTPHLIRGHGGVALGWHSRFYDLVSPTPIISTHQFIGIEIKTSRTPIQIFSVYLPSRSGCTDVFREALDNLNATMNSLPSISNTVVLGDFNADPGCHGGPLSTTSVNQQGRILSQYLSLWNFVSAHLHKSNLSSSHTFESEAHNSLSTIDHIICHQTLLPRIEYATTLPDDPLNTSDHLPVVAVIQFNLSQPAPSEPLVNRSKSAFTPRNWFRITKQDINSLYTKPLHQPLLDLLQTLPPEPTLSNQPSLINTHLSALSDLLLNFSINIPPKTYQQFKRPAWGPVLKAAKRKSKHCYYLWVAAGKPRDPAHPTRATYKAAKKNYRRQIRFHKKLSDETFYNSLDLEQDSRHFFQAIRNHTSSSSVQPPTNSITVDGAMYEGPNILEGWALYFETLCASSIPPATDLACRSETLHLLRNLPDVEPDLISTDEIESVIFSLPRGKAAGPDNLSNEHLIFSHPLTANILKVIFNSILLSGHIPTSFQLGLIVPIPKGRNADFTNPSNFRGITLLSVISKVFEKLILSRLSTQMSLIHPLQGGFKPRMSCMHTAFILQEAVRSLRVQKKKAYVAFLDVRKAFDTVWHSGLLLKLIQFQVPKYIWSIINNWYHHCTSSILWNSSTSRSFSVQQGVRQGAVLSPLLYCIFVNDLLSQLSSSGYGVRVHNIFCGSPMYADDLALISHSSSDLQDMLDIVSNYAQKWWYKMNAEKSSILVFGESLAVRTRNRPLRHWFVSGESIPEKDSQHHLGFLLIISCPHFRTVQCW